MTVRDFASLVRKAWGDEYFQPDTGYEWSNARKFNDSGKYGGIYVPATADSTTHRAMDAGNVGTAQAGFTITFFDADVHRGKAIGGDLGQYALTGIAAAVRHGYVLSADLGAFTVTGVGPGLKITNSVGSFAVTGIDATLTKALKSAGSLTASMGTFSVTGNDIFLTK